MVSPHTAGIAGVVPPMAPMGSQPGAEAHTGEPSMDLMALPPTPAVGRVVPPTVPTASLPGAEVHTGEPSMDIMASAPTAAVPPEELCMGPMVSPHGAALDTRPLYLQTVEKIVTTSD